MGGAGIDTASSSSPVRPRPGMWMVDPGARTRGRTHSPGAPRVSAPCIPRTPAPWPGRWTKGTTSLRGSNITLRTPSSSARSEPRHLAPSVPPRGRRVGLGPDVCRPTVATPGPAPRDATTTRSISGGTYRIRAADGQTLIRRGSRATHALGVCRGQVGLLALEMPGQRTPRLLATVIAVEHHGPRSGRARDGPYCAEACPRVRALVVVMACGSCYTKPCA